MSKTKIEWAEATWNPTVGCRRIGEGCAHCYAERWALRLSAMGRLEYAGLLTEDGRWNGTVRTLPGRLNEPLSWKTPRRVFVDSMSDLFHSSVPDDFILDVMRVIKRCDQHTFIILTKRIKRAQVLFSRLWQEDRILWLDGPMGYNGFSLPNLWLLVSVSNQAEADRDIPILLRTHAPVLGLSLEPLLGPVDLGDYLWSVSAGHGARLNALRWVVVGGETGPGARPMHPGWIRSIRDQCQAAGVPFFFKSWGEWTNEFPQGRSLANIRQTFENGMGFYRVGKTAAGRLLDGREYSQYPEVK